MSNQQQSDGANGMPPMPPIVYAKLAQGVDAPVPAPDDEQRLLLLTRLGEQVRDWRLTRALTRAQLAARLGMAAETLFCWEQGIAETADVTAEQLHVLHSLLTESLLDQQMALLIHTLLEP